MIRRDVVRNGAALVSPFSRKWLSPETVAGPLVVLIHGLAADGTHLVPLAELLQSHGYSPALFEYDSHLGIAAATASLRERLEPIEPLITTHGCSLIGHSMGGLVAKCFATRLFVPLRTVAMLGTPNASVFGNKLLVAALVRAAEALGPRQPFGRSLSCEAVRELTGSDQAKILSSLAGATISVPVFSVSGGLSFLEFGSSLVTNVLTNLLIQRLLSEHPNDGLVLETSADSRGHVVGLAEHYNHYSEYTTTNHNGVFRNQAVALRLVQWLQVHQPVGRPSGVVEI